MATPSETHPDIVRIGTESGASLTTLSTPLILDISPTHLTNLPEQRRAIVNLISTTAQATLTRCHHFSFQLPQTEFITDQSSGQTLEPLISVAQLCTQPDETNELPEITLDPQTGERRRITAEQIHDIVNNGRFAYPSRQFPHINHVWQLPTWMVRGRNNVHNDFKNRLGYSLDHLLIHCPNRIYHKPHPWQPNGFFSLSIWNGFYHIALQMKAIVAALVGLPETVPRRTEYKHRNLAEEQYVREKCNEAELLDFSYYFDPSPTAARYSTRLQDERASAYDETYRLAALETFRAVSPDSLSTFERISLIDTKWQHQLREKHIETIMETEPDEQRRSVIVEYVRAQHIIDDGDTKLLARFNREKRQLIEEAKRTHPILSLGQAWLRRWVLKKAAKHYDEWQREQEDENIATMRSSNLHRAAKFEEAKLQFQREAWPDLRASWLRDRVAAREYIHKYVIFNPRLWREGWEPDERKVRTTTAHAGWRLVLLWRDMISFMRGGLYFTLVANLWRGPVGIQALFRWGNVPYSWERDANGAIRATKFYMSMCTRLRAIWQRVRELRAEFEEAEDTVFGKDAVRWLHFVVNYGFRGVLSTAVVIVGQPLLTVVNVVVTAVIATAAMVLAPLSAFVTYCTSWLVYDWRSFEIYNVEYFQIGNSFDVYIRTSTKRSSRWFPVISHIWRSLLGGLESCISGISCLVHPLYSVFRSALACVQRAFRWPWDGMWSGLLRRFGRWPARDTFLAQRISGVGLSGCYYFRLSTELVLRCLRAKLELMELMEARSIIGNAAMKPVKELEMFTEDVITGLCEQAGEWGSTMKMLQKEEEGRMKQISNDFGNRANMLYRLTNMPEAKERIRPEKGVAPDQVLEKCVELVEMFHEERIKQLGEVSTRLWRRAGASPGDVKTVTRYLLADLFSEEFLTPLETSDETLEIPVTFDDLINVYARRGTARGTAATRRGDDRDVDDDVYDVEDVEDILPNPYF